jgi:hypothetical protein
MGFSLKKLTWKKVGKGIGKVVDNKFVKGAAALGLAATGVGAPAAAGIIGGMSAGGKLAQGKRLTTAVKGGVVDGGLTYVGGKIAGKVMPKLGGMLNKVPGLNKIPGVGNVMSGGGDDIGGLVEGAGDIAGQGRFRKIASGVGKFIGGSDGFGMDDVLKYGKAAGDAYGAYTGAKDQDRYRQLAEQNYAANAPLRDAGRTMLMDNSTPDLSGLFADPTAPQGRYRKVNVGSRGIV